MKKLVAMALSIVMILGAVQAVALDYGEEWQGYYKTAPVNYSDVHPNDWFYNSVMRVTEKNWFKGYPDNSFRPNASITRAEAIKVFAVFLGLDVQPVCETSYYDVDANAWYAPYIEAGKDLLPVHTTVQGKKPFNPDMPITREDTVYALVQALGCMENVKIVDQSVLNMFKDQKSISDSLKPYFAIALQEELVSGYGDGTIRAQDPLTRAEFATLLVRGTNHGFHNISAKISKVQLNQESKLVLEVGESVELTAEAVYTDNSAKKYTAFVPYIMSGTSAISLNGKTVVGVKQGTATIGFEDQYLGKATLSIEVKAPSSKPKLKVYYSDETEDKTTKITGSISDENVKTVDLTVNGKDVAVNDDGSFELTVDLKEGENNFEIKAVNQYEIETSKTIVITRKTTVKKNSNWVSASQVPSGAKIVNRKFQYNVCEYRESEADSIAGWEKYDSSWKQSNSGSFQFASFPGGFDTGHSLYRNIQKSRYTDFENASSKRVTSVSHDGYIYWHWTFSKGWLPNNNYNVFIEDHYTDKYCFFSAFSSRTNAGKVDPNGRGDGICYYVWSGDVNQGSWWWHRIDLYVCSYTDYVKVNKFRKMTAKESASYPTESGAINIVEMVQYEM